MLVFRLLKKKKKKGGENKLFLLGEAGTTSMQAGSLPKE